MLSGARDKDVWLFKGNWALIQTDTSDFLTLCMVLNGSIGNAEFF